MVELASDPQQAREQMNGLIFYLATFGYADGDFAASEIDFIRSTIRSTVEARVPISRVGGDQSVRDEVVSALTADYEEVLDGVLGEVTRLFSEAVAEAEPRSTFVTSKLKQRCFEIFTSFEPDVQRQLIAVADDLILADGHAHPAELDLRKELTALLSFEAAPFPDLVDIERRVEVREHEPVAYEAEPHPLFDEIETHYVRDDAARERQLAGDWALLRATLSILDQQRQQGHGRLRGLASVAGIGEGPPFLDDFVYVLPAQPEKAYDLTVIGDLHGCYSNLKAALMQSGFLRKVAAYRKSPSTEPDPKLVLMGDYLDRGRWSYEGVVRLALQLFTSFPEHVYLLRGNHELYVEKDDGVVSAVQPAEAINRLRPFAPVDLFRDYLRLYNSLPSMLLCGRTIFVHGGVPRDAVSAEKITDLSGLNDWVVRFQMMWSDPSSVDVIPRPLQESTYRFAYGRLQCLSFLQRLGCHTLVRGHEHVLEGFRRNYDDERMLAVTVFSAGGADNPDVPPESDFRRVRPMYARVETSGEVDGASTIHAYPIDFSRFNAPETNRFLAAEPEIP